MDPNVLRLAMGAAGAGGVDNKLYSWGANDRGQGGLNNTTDYSSPKQVGLLTNWSEVSSGRNGCAAIKTDGTLWTWGYNNQGQLGDGTTVTKSSPVQVGSLTTWSKIACGQYHVLAIKTDGTLWSWGMNFSGQLGDGTTTGKSSPIQIGAATDWASIGTCTNSSFAIKTNGTLWSWGANYQGQLGLGTSGSASYRSSPVQVGALTNWSFIQKSCGGFHTAAVKTDGTLWTWGNNNVGQLGLGNTTYYSSPKQVGTGTNWSKTAVGGLTSHFIKTDGTLWAVGNGSLGRLGLGGSASYSSPKQVGALSNWSSVFSGGRAHSLAIKTDKTLWAWGRNNRGQIGDGTTTDRYSPVQIGSAITWSTAACGYYFSAGTTQ